MHIILEPPYVSSTLLDAITNNSVKVVHTSFAEDYGQISEQVVRLAPDEEIPSFYTNSENALDWIVQNYPESDVTKRIKKLKDKALFRTIIKELHPNFFFQEASIEEITAWSELPTDKTIVIKPTVGFLSLGVIKVKDQDQWDRKREKLLTNLASIKSYYPKAVVDANRFIVEEFLDGPEFAIDAYFDAEGEPVILNISEHLFATPNDVNDRVYFTSKEIISKYHDDFKSYLKKTGDLLDIKNFPVHAEIRITSAHGIVPIEFNALRFGGWCTSADVGSYAFGFNLYEYFFNQQKPNWEAILEQMNDDLYSFIMLDNITDRPNKEIKTFDINALAGSLEDVLEIRSFDHQEYPIFGILIARTSKDNQKELLNVLKSDFKDCMTF